MMETSGYCKCSIKEIGVQKQAMPQRNTSTQAPLHAKLARMLLHKLKQLALLTP